MHSCPLMSPLRPLMSPQSLSPRPRAVEDACSFPHRPHHVDRPLLPVKPWNLDPRSTKERPTDPRRRPTTTDRPTTDRPTDQRIAGGERRRRRPIDRPMPRPTDDDDDRPADWPTDRRTTHRPTDRRRRPTTTRTDRPTGRPIDGDDRRRRPSNRSTARPTDRRLRRRIDRPTSTDPAADRATER